MILGRRNVLPERADPNPPIAPAASLPRLLLVLGGARSGKSRYAESVIERAACPALYIATAEPRDGEMQERIRRHRVCRGPRWTTLEEPLDLVARLACESRAGRPILVDCLTLWLANLLEAGRAVEQEAAALVEALGALAGPTVLVANEVGLGIVPENALARAFRDHAGRLNQSVAARASRVVFIAAGLPLVLKDQR